eukprot:TRINITY_DN25383_c0_g1_i1.p1 TRINITY_DN25383_c0_g1~~TRINITY_DN25383_c0_g1_i1.p1  ORF type:complete len:396 (+),score=114.82 TRINITY_DN25383_c0_g1_i1:160-1347(+)
MHVTVCLPDVGVEVDVDVAACDTVGCLCARAAAAAGMDVAEGGPLGGGPFVLEMAEGECPDAGTPLHDTGLDDGDRVLARVPTHVLARKALADRGVGGEWADVRAAWEAGDAPLVTTILQAGLARKTNLIAEAMRHGADGLALEVINAATGDELDVMDSCTALTPLMHAGQAGAVDLVRAALARGASAGAANVHGYTALMYAAASGSVASCELLVGAGAAVVHDNLKRLSPLSTAAHGGHLDVARALLRHNPSLGRALYQAAQEGHPAMCELLLAAGADVNEIDPRARATPLQAAAGRGHAGCVALLLAHGAAVDLRNNQRMTAAMFAARGGAPACLEALLEAGADVHAADVEGRTAAFLASLFATAGHAAAAALLARYGAAATAPDEYEHPELF